ncbi:MAG: hypothetical protein K1X88_21725 [Nannocystaceae bacterium]|nr:hypothetical protein [Nannocystaceae bacterium]
MVRRRHALALALLCAPALVPTAVDAAPSKPAAVKPEPAPGKTEPIKPEPAKAEPGKTEPTPGDPKTGPGTEPPPDDPLPVDAPPPGDEPPPEPSATATVDAAAVAALQQDARALRDALFKARGRVSLVASKLFTTRVALQLRSNVERFYEVTDLTLRVDGAPVYVQEKGLPKTDGDLFEVFAAPGSHELALSANLVARRDATYKIRIDYAVWFAVDANMRVSSKLQLREHGNMWRFASKRRGASDVRLRLRAVSKPLDKGRRGKASAGASVGASAGGKAK